MPQGVESSVQAKNKARRPRQRASIACQSCNSKRIRCNAAIVGLPCLNCKRSARTCQLIESRRGQRRAKRASDPLAKIAQQDLGQTVSGTSAFDRCHTVEVTVRSTIESQDEGKNISPKEVNIASSDHLQVENVIENVQEQVEPPEAFPTHTLKATNAEKHISTERCEQSTLPVQILDLTRFSLDKPISDVRNSNIVGMGQDERDVLGMQHAFEVPKSDACLQLFRAYFIHVAPAYPIIDRANFMFQYAIPHRPPSWLLLQAVLFAAAGHCEEDLLKNAGFASRSEARMKLFRRTKALYDADHEKDKFTIIQATFLMSLRWDSPVESKDNWYWLELSINLALVLGIPRLTKDPGKPLEIRRLWKRLWWSLYAEDKYIAATLGRPVRLRSSECNIEPLEMADFDGEPYGFGDTLRVGLPQVIKAYPICLASLAKVAERIIERSPQISSANYSPELSDAMLQVWEAGLPEFYQLKSQEKKETVWPNMIQIAAWILVYRTHLQVNFPIPVPDNTHQKAIEAAFQIVSIVEDLLVSEKIQHCPVLIIQALYGAMSTVGTTIQSRRGIIHRLAYVKHNVCVIALQELEASWPISRWILSAFAENVQGVPAERHVHSSITDGDYSLFRIT